MNDDEQKVNDDEQKAQKEKRPFQIPVFLKGIFVVFVALVIVAGVSSAGSITPPVGTPVATFYTLTDLYNLVNSNTTTTAGNHDFTFADTLEGTGYTLTQIYTALTGLVSPARVLLGTTYLGTPGTYDATNLSATTVKSGVEFGVNATGTYSGFPGTGWVGPGGITLDQEDCEDAAGWYWFEDANGDGDTTDSGDGICVEEDVLATVSFSGTEQVAAAGDITGNTATGGSSNTVEDTGAGWTVDTFANMTVKITSGTAANCWGIVKSNTSDTITVYGSWRDASYYSNCGTPDATSVFSVWGGGVTDRDMTWIGDWSCTGSFPTGTVVWGSFPTSAQVGGSNIALASADCYDGQRDLLPTETDRTVLSGTATAADATTITDSSLLMRQNVFSGQKIVITGGTGVGGNARIESNATTTITVASWTGGTPDAGSTFGVVYLIPHARTNSNSDITGGDNDSFNGDRGPLVPSVLADWKGTRLPSRADVWGYCGYKDGGSNYENTTSTYSADKTFGTDGGQVGRTDEFLDRPSAAWMSEVSSSGNALLSSSNNCTSFSVTNIINNGDIRAVFRP